MTATRKASDTPLPVCLHLTTPLVTPDQLVTANRHRIRCLFAPAYHHALAHRWGHLVLAIGLAAAARKFKRRGGPAWTTERSYTLFEVRETVEVQR